MWFDSTPPTFFTLKTNTMEFKGTKGKWLVVGDSDTSIISEMASEHLATCWCVYNTVNLCLQEEKVLETKANALLISKAAEMLEMLKEFIDNLCGEQECEEELIKGLGHQTYNSVLKAKQLIKEATTI